MAERSIKNFIAGLELISQYLPEGIDTSYFFEAAHDIIFTHVTETQIPTGSIDGDLLERFGFHFDEATDVWAYCT